MKMKQKQDPPTCPCYATPRVYLDAYIVGARISEDFVSGTCPIKFNQLDFMRHVPGRKFVAAVCSRDMFLRHDLLCGPTFTVHKNAMICFIQ